MSILLISGEFVSVWKNIGVCFSVLSFFCDITLGVNKRGLSLLLVAIKRYLVP